MSMASVASPIGMRILGDPGGRSSPIAFEAESPSAAGPSVQESEEITAVHRILLPVVWRDRLCENGSLSEKPGTRPRSLHPNPIRLARVLPRVAEKRALRKPPAFQVSSLRKCCKIEQVRTSSVSPSESCWGQGRVSNVERGEMLDGACAFGRD